MNSSHNDRRRATRHQLILDLFFDGAESVGVTQTRDISTHGLYFNSLTIFPKGAKLKLRLPLNDTREFIVLDAEVVYSQPKIGCAVEFYGLTDETRNALELFIQEAQESRVNNWEVAAA